MKSTVLKFNPFFLYILCLYEFIKCKAIYIDNYNEEKVNNSIICSTKNSDLYLPNEYNDFEKEEVFSTTLNIGKIQTIFLNSSNIYQFYFSKIKVESDLLVNIYPLDCPIQISASDESITIENISNYEYDAFFVIIKKEKIDSSYIRIKPLINPLEEKNRKRTYHLIFNSFDKSNPQLIFNEKFPTLIYFYSSLEKMKFIYESNNSKEPVVFSFFIKERNRFNVTISKDENQNRIIAYKDNIIIDPKIVSYDNIDIFVKKMDNKNCAMIVKVSGNSLPFYLQKNNLNLGFMPINTSHHFYYMEVFKGEEGEIMLYNKIHNGYLSFEIINKNKVTENDIIINPGRYFPNYDDKNVSLFNKYNAFTKKLNFSYNETEYCENGCYLLITYYSPEINLTNITGIEYTLLARIWDENEFKSQIVNIPLNEYVFGVNEAFSNSINAHYYTAYIPEGSDIIFEFQGANIDVFSKKGILQINILKQPYNSLILINNTDIYDDKEDEKYVIQLNKQQLGMERFESQYISFAFKIIYDDELSNSLLNYYYFRIIQEKSKNNFIIYPLDTNKVNLCRTTEFQKDYVCYFIMKNDYNQLTNNFSIYAYGKKEATLYEAWPIYQMDYYSIDINSIKYEYKNKNNYSKKGGYLELFFKDNFNYILLEIHSEEEEILEVLFNFDCELILFPSLDIYSYQSFLLKKNKDKVFNFHYISSKEYKIIINNTFGEGNMYTIPNFRNNNKGIPLSGNGFTSFPISERSLHFESKKDLFFYLKMENILEEGLVERIGFGPQYIEIISDYENLKYYYIQDIFKKGVEIFFSLHLNNNNFKEEEIKVLGTQISYDQLKSLKNEEIINNLFSNNIYYYNNYFEGKFDPFTKTGLVSFYNILSKNESIDYSIYLFTIYGVVDEISESFAQLYITPKNEFRKNLPLNKYIRGAFNLFNYSEYQNKTFYINFEKDEFGTYVLEFSSNSKDIIPIFNNELNYYKKTISGGFEKYFISKENIDDKKYNFTIQIRNTTNNQYSEDYQYPFFLKNYIIKFYKEDLMHRQEYNINKKIEWEKMDNKSNYKFTVKTVKNNELNYNNNLANNCEFRYLLSLYLKKYFYQPQLINTTAFIFYMNTNPINTQMIITDDPEKEISFYFNNLLDDEIYILYLFIKADINDTEEKYYSTYIELDTKKDNEDNTKSLIIIIIISITIIIVTLAIFIIVCIIYKKKNENLKEQVEAISFSRGIDEDSLIKKNSKHSKDDEDYESTFI